jgi:hypothetical protein
MFFSLSLLPHRHTNLHGHLGGVEVHKQTDSLPPRSCEHLAHHSFDHNAKNLESVTMDRFLWTILWIHKCIYTHLECVCHTDGVLVAEHACALRKEQPERRLHDVIDVTQTVTWRSAYLEPQHLLVCHAANRSVEILMVHLHDVSIASQSKTDTHKARKTIHTSTTDLQQEELLPHARVVHGRIAPLN